MLVSSNANRLSDEMKFTLLQNAVCPMPCLHGVKEQQDGLVASGIKKATFNDYLGLLNLAAEQYDHDLKAKHGTGQACKCTVY